MAFQPQDIDHIEIFPPIGIARVGNAPAPDSYYIGPEIPDRADIPDGGFKVDGLIKRQAVRFRVYAFNSQNQVLGEVNTTGNYKLKWTAAVANGKAAGYTFKRRYSPPVEQIPPNHPLRNASVKGDDRQHLTIKSEATVEGPNATSSPLQGNFKATGPALSVYLGELRTDERGRLLFLGGHGKSVYTKEPESSNPPFNNFVDNDEWVDDSSDGSITVEVSHGDLQGPLKPKYGAWVITAPPKFSWGVHAPVRLYDLIENIYPAKERKVNFYRDIWPLLNSTHTLAWVHAPANKGHGPNRKYDFVKLQDKLNSPEGSADLRSTIFEVIRVPVTADIEKRREMNDSSYMPKLRGDANGTTDPNNPNGWLSVTTLQYERLTAWKDGNFETGHPYDPVSDFDSIPVGDQPAALTLAALQWGTGGAFYPGIEVWWRGALPNWYAIDPENNGFPADIPPFRFSHDKVQPGQVTQGLAIPWQADFYDCNTDWWPSARPDDSEGPNGNRLQWDRGLPQSVPNGNGMFGMVRNFYKLGFIAPNAQGKHEEIDRSLN